MSGISISQSYHRPCSGRKTLRRCRNNEETDDVIMIDVDSDQFDNVIIIDVPESSPKTGHGSKIPRKDKKKSSLKNVIYIDDDEVPDDNHYGIGSRKSSFTANASSSRKSRPATSNFRDAAEAASKEPQVEENATPVRLSKCKRTYSGKSSSRNHYGLDTDSETDSSNSYHDFELIEDSSGKVQEQWEKAFFKKRKGTQNGDIGVRDHDSSSWGVNGNHCPDVEGRGAARVRKDPSTGMSNKEGQASSRSNKKGDACYGSTHVPPDPIIDDFSSPTERKSDLHYDMSDAHSGLDSRPRSSSLHSTEEGDNLDREPGIPRRRNEEKLKPPASSNSGHQEHSTKEVNHRMPAFRDEDIPNVEPFSPKSEAFVYKESSCGKASPEEDGGTMSKFQSSFKTQAESGSSFPRDNCNRSQKATTGSFGDREQVEPSQPHAADSADKMENLMPERSPKTSSLPDKHANQSISPQGNADEAKLGQEYSVSDSRQEDKDDQLHSQNGDGLPPSEISIINDREKLKETDEYKRAIEEELAARKKAVEIQAAEAQHQRLLLKRRKAEKMRLLDMERRQKERIEEMRNAQKKDEENMNIKEVLRAKVRMELNRLETSCRDLHSLLHSLGIRVGGWPNPLPQEVQAAYKRALLTFHPDRALRSDIRQQVEAEEKFKLINRLKEKFAPSLAIK